MSDLLIAGGDLLFNSQSEPVGIAGLDMLLQDLSFRIRESPLSAQLIGASQAERANIYYQIALLLEQDPRLLSGQTQVLQTEPGKISFAARASSGSALKGYVLIPTA